MKERIDPYVPAPVSRPAVVIEVSSRAARWILNLWIVVGLGAAVAVLVLAILCAITARETGLELEEFRGVIEGVGTVP